MPALLKAKQPASVSRGDFRPVGERAPTLLKVKQLFLLLQDGFRALGECAPDPELINTLKSEIKQLKDFVSNLGLCEVRALAEKLEAILEIIPQSIELRSPVFNSEDIQLILEALRIISTRFQEGVAPNSINVSDIACVLDTLYQQKSSEITMTTKTQISIPAEQSEKTQEVMSKESVLEADTNIETDVTKQITEAHLEERVKSVELNEDSGILTNVTNQAPHDAPPFIETPEKAESISAPAVTSSVSPQVSVCEPNGPVIPYIIIGVNSQTFALPYQVVEKVQKLALSELKLIKNEIVANIDGNDVTMFDLPSVLGSKKDGEPEKETFLAAICKTETGKAGLLFDKILGFEDLEVAKFYSILGKLKGIAGISAVKIKAQNSVDAERYQPVFVLDPAEFHTIFQTQSK
jgi:chemotaxis protein histidine kinase CheA